jgi:hypothetical protein
VAAESFAGHESSARNDHFTGNQVAGCCTVMQVFVTDVLFHEGVPFGPHKRLVCNAIQSLI